MNCRARFKEARGFELPAGRDWNAEAYRAWVEWSYACRLEIWDLYNAAARDAGGPECLWVGMIGGSLSGAAVAFRDYREICRRAKMIMLDSQRRSDATGFQANGQTGKLVHGLLGWDKLAPESMALYHTAGVSFRLASRPEPEVRLWAVEGFAAGIQPWWHYVNAYREDRRMYDTPLALSEWYVGNERFLHGRTPVATVGIVYSQRNYDFFGRDHADVLVDQPQRGFTQALTRARIPYVLVHADDIERDGPALKTLVLPNLGVMTSAQTDAVRAFVRSRRRPGRDRSHESPRRVGSGASGLRACRHASASGFRPATRCATRRSASAGRRTKHRATFASAPNCAPDFRVRTWQGSRK